MNKKRLSRLFCTLLSLILTATCTLSQFGVVNAFASVTEFGENSISVASDDTKIIYQSSTSTTSTADTIVTANGTCGENLTWTLDSEGTLTISGTGDMANMNSDSCQWKKYRELIKRVIINKGVTSIGGHAFYYCSNLESITIPDSVTSIGGYAFYYCSNLESITIPDSVVNIGDEAFSYCTNLKSITIPDSVTSIGASAFYLCSSLESITISDSVTNIGASAFDLCSSLESINVSESNKNYSSEDGVLFNKDKSTILCFPVAKATIKYNIPDSVTSIGVQVFENCTSLESITIPDSVTCIDYSTFSGCSSLKSITIPDSVTSIGSCAFYLCSNLESITIPDSVTNIDSYAFYSCSSLESITIPDSVTSIGDAAFERCSNLESITIPDSVTCIDYSTFLGCSSLKSITIPDSVTSIGDSAFIECTSLESISIFNPKCEIYDDEYTISQQATIKGYKGSTAEAYAQKYNRTFIAIVTANGTCGENLTWTLDSEGTLTISGTGDMAKMYSDSCPWKEYKELIKRVIINKGVTSIVSYAFYWCLNLESITIPDSVTSIGDAAFYNCTSLESITIPDSVTNIGSYAFYGCSSLKSISISDSVTSIGYYAFSFCSSLESITIPDSVTSIDSSTFHSCSSLESITIPDSVTSIGGWAFYYCSNLKSITIPDSVTSIGNIALCSCTNLESVSIFNPKCEIYDDEYTISQQATIKGYKGSTAEAYAQKYNRTFIALDDEIPVTTTTTTTSTSKTTTTTTVKTTTTTTRTSTTSTTTSSTTTSTTTSTTSSTKTTTATTSITTTTTTKPNYKGFYYQKINNGIEITGSDSTVTGNIVIPEKIDGLPVMRISYHAFSNKKDITSVSIPGSVKEIGMGAFLLCENLKKVVFSSGLEKIGNDAFGSTGITEIILPDSVEYIGKTVFAFSSLNKIKIPSSIKQIGEEAFYECPNLKEINVDNNDYYNSIDGVLYNKDITSLIAYPASRDGASYTIPSSVNKIETAAFCDASNLSSIILPDSINYIGEHAFQNCTSLTNINIPQNLSIIMVGVFYNCSKLKTITLPESITEINSNAFYKCSEMTDIYIFNPECLIYHSEIPSTTTIHGYKDSTAESYANKNGRKFVAIPPTETTTTTNVKTTIATVTTTSTTAKTTTSTTVKTTTSSTTTSTTTSTTSSTTKTTTSSTNTTFTTTSTTIATTTIADNYIKEKFILQLMPFASKVYETVADIKSIKSTDNSVGVCVISEDKRYLSITGANSGYAEITVELVNGDKYLVCLTVGYDTGHNDTQTTTTILTTTTRTTTTTLTTTTRVATTSTSKATTTSITTSTNTSTTSTTTISTTATTTIITSTTNAFDRDTDTWSFINKAGLFWDGSGLLMLKNEIDQLQKIKDFYNKPSFSKALDTYVNEHSGSCYGMTTLALISFFNKDYLSLLQEGADNINNIKLDDNLKSIINYYSSLQLVPEIRYAFKKFILDENSETKRIQKIIDLISNGPVLVCYQVTASPKQNTNTVSVNDSNKDENPYYTHAVIAYDIVPYVPTNDEDAEFFSNLHYIQGSDTLKMIKVYDPNYYSDSEDANIFVNAVEKSGEIKYYWGVKEQFAYNKIARNKTIMFVSNDTELLDRYGLYSDADNYNDIDAKDFYPELEVNTDDTNYDLYNIYKKTYRIDEPIEDDEPYALLPILGHDSSKSICDNYALKYNNEDYKFKYNDNQYKSTELKTSYANTTFSFNSEIKSATFNQNIATYEVKKNSKFTLTAISDSNDMPKGFYEVVVMGTMPVNGKIICNYDAGLWHITSSSPLSNIDIYATNGIDCNNQHRSYSAKYNNITIQYSNSERSKIMITEKIDTEIIDEVLLGDVDNDGQINSVDASSVLAYYALISTNNEGKNKEGEYDKRQILAADVNNDGYVNSVDASKILAYYAYVSTTKEEILSIEEYLKMKKR